jgi:hypothetical protein
MFNVSFKTEQKCIAESESPPNSIKESSKLILSMCKTSFKILIIAESILFLGFEQY